MAKFDRVEELEALARHMVGDGGHPNMYFVSSGGTISTVTGSKSAAMKAAHDLDGEVLVEDRIHGEVWGNAAYNRSQQVED